MGSRLLQLVSAAGLIAGLVAVVVLVETAVVNPDVGQRVNRRGSVSRGCDPW
jgi:hypothetical protein